MTPEALEEAGRIAARHARQWWSIGVHDPKKGDKSEAAIRDVALIDGLIRGKGGLGWAWKPPYRYDKDPNHPGGWCGALPAACWAPAGLGFQIRFRNLASTMRLFNWAKGTARVIPALTLLRHGDILIVGTKDPVHGDHIVMAVDKPIAGAIEDIEGNGHGAFPDGSRGHGIVRNVRPLKQIVHAYRPLPEDLGPVVADPE